MSQKSFQINLTQEQVSIVGAALVELPYKTVSGLIQHINDEIQRSLELEAAKPAAQAPRRRRAPAKVPEVSKDQQAV